ncbi:MAG: hypothetical protein R3236_10445, partial [Phycisphaeraceae bacterium]|nr:hypothetical protein [Phycisphaeraceae bacterium]
DHFRRTFLGVELLNRFTHVDNESSTGPHRILTTAWKLPAWFTIRFLPWSIPFIGWVGARLIKRVRRAVQRRGTAARFKALFETTTDPVGPAVIWCGLALVFYSCVAWKRADYLMPLYPPAAIIVARDLLGWRRKNLTASVAMATACCVSLGIAAYWFAFSHAARTGHGRAVGRFAQQVREQTGHDRIVFEHSGYNGLQSLLGHHQPDPDEAVRREANWVIRKIENEKDRRRAVVRSDQIIDRGDRRLHLGLFKRDGELKPPE